MGLLRLVAIIALAFVGVQLLRRILRIGPSRKNPLEKARTIKGADMVKDPVCGVYTPRDSALITHQGDQVRYFCSEKCRDAFTRDAHLKS
jgi:YHS domain-containing protein